VVSYQAYLFGSVVRRHNDCGKPDGILQQPHVNENHQPRVSSHNVGHLVIDVEQRHHSQREQRQAYREAKQVDQHGQGVTDQLVPDPYHLHGVGDRLFAGTTVEIAAVGNPSSGGGCGNRRRDQSGGYRFTRRRIVDGGHLLAKQLQVPVDHEKLVTQHAAPRHEVRLTQTHGHVLQVHEYEEYQHDSV